jgi:hypothetical protein
MMMKVLVYDNQVGYFSLLTDTLSEGYDFLLYNKRANYDDRYDAVIFFLHDDLELLDMVKLYNPEIPFILGATKKGSHYLQGKEMLFTIDISQTKDEIEKNLQTIFNKIGQLNEKEEAL